MKTEIFYYFILLVYVSLLCCQFIACHLLHSLIILTDSYINLYRILDISLGILHLRTQHKLSRRIKDHDDDDDDKENKKKRVELFNHICTYQFKRLPLLGSFVNGLFLAALLMSAAIEGIQTCFHASHSEGADKGAIKSILIENPTIYPAILVGFALIGIIMHWCSGKAHEMRELDLLSTSGCSSDNSSTESLFYNNATTTLFSRYSNNNSNTNQRSQNQNNNMMTISELDIRSCQVDEKIKLPSSNQEKNFYFNNTNLIDKRKFSLKTKSAESIPKDSSDNSNVSLKSLRIISNLDELNCAVVVDDGMSKSAISTISNIIINSTPIQYQLDNEPMSDDKQIKKRQHKKSSFAYVDDAHWAIIRYCTSPMALISCALIVYLINHELVTEIADASLAILVVVLLFSASYPPMKKAGRVLLQTAPPGLEPDVLKDKIKSLNASIIDVREFHIWSLTAEGNRVGTCHLILNANTIQSEGQLVALMKEVRGLLLQNHIKCSTIQPVLIDPNYNAAIASQPVGRQQLSSAPPIELPSKQTETTTTTTTTQ